SSAPWSPSTCRETDPKTVVPFIKVAVIVWTLNGSGSASNPNIVAGRERVRVTALAPPVARTRGVLVSVLGGEFQVCQLLGTVRAVIGIENETVCVAFVTEVTTVPSGTVIGRTVVDPI